MIYGHESESCCDLSYFFFHTLLLRCAIYRLPDAHTHITRPPQGVKFPKKVLNLVAAPYSYPPTSKSLSQSWVQFQMFVTKYAMLPTIKKFIEDMLQILHILIFKYITFS